MEKVQVDERSLVTAEEVVTPFDFTTYPPTAQVSVVTFNEGVPTQLANPRRTTKRAVFQLLVVLFPAIPAIALIVLDVWSPDWLVLVLGYVVAAHGAVVRIMALPGVNEWIKAHLPGLAPIPLVAAETLQLPEAR